MKHGGLFARPIPRWWLNPPAPLRYAVSAALIGAAVAVNMLIEKRFVGAPALLLLCAVPLDLRIICLRAFAGCVGPRQA
jgi:hypothetical protein